MATAAVDSRHWTREDYERLVEDGYFQPGERVELIDGVIYEMTPLKSPHATGVRLTARALEGWFREGFDVRTQMPLAVGPHSEPEPDVAVVQGDPRDFAASHPTTAVLIVEVADSSLYQDRRRKASLYARVGILEYWILNLVKRRLEVYRDSKDGSYTTRFVLRDGDSVSPISRPEASITVASLLP